MKSYSVSYAYSTPDAARFGIVSKRMMSLDEIDFVFKSVSVDKCRSWISVVKSLRRGSSAEIRIAEKSETGEIFMKGWIVRKV